jgi:predicted patatin/cPLA2 family phospholipase
MARLTSILKESGRAAPVLCIQGGGARGAWEAGVLAGLLKAGANTSPSSIWGTSAGALNALWSRDPEILAEPTKLVCFWALLARRLIIIASVSIIAILYVIHLLPIKFTLWCGLAVVSAMFSSYVLAKRQMFVRLPGLIPSVLARLIVPRPHSIAPGHFVYTCVTNVASETRPQLWDGSRGGWFLLSSESSDCSAEDLRTGERVDAFRVAVASASVPGLVYPTQLAGMTLLDGGLIANLPAGFIRSNGALGGAYVLCIVPRDLAELSDPNPIDDRTLRFLFDLRDEQAKHRSAAADASSWSGPSHTHTPIFVLTPKQRLKSRLAFFWPPLLRREFWQGYREANSFSDALHAFSLGNSSLISEYLLERVLQRVNSPVREPGRPFWYVWVNTRW